MRFTLKDYQADAVVDVLRNLRKARRNWQEDGDSTAFSLTATTGAGKTVMAAAVIEALFDGITTITTSTRTPAPWCCGSPTIRHLNEQTRGLTAGGRPTWNSSVACRSSTPDFNQADALSPGKVYFLNRAKARQELAAGSRCAGRSGTTCSR